MRMSKSKTDNKAMTDKNSNLNATTKPTIGMKGVPEGKKGKKPMMAPKKKG